MSSSPPYELAWVKSSALSSAGEVQNIEWKAFVYHSGIVFWELRRVFLNLVDGVAVRLDLRRKVKKHRLQWEAQMQKIGLHLADVLKPSTRAAHCANHQDVLDEYTRDEWTMRTDGVIMMLLLWARERHLLAQRSRAKALLKAVLLQFVTAVAGLAHGVADGWARRSAGFCQEGPVAGGMCCHVAGAMAARDAPACDVVAPVVAILIALNAAADKCLAARSMLGGLVTDLIDRLYAAFSSGGERFSKGILKMEHARIGGRKLRCDSDFKRHIVEQVVRQGACHNGSQALRIEGELHPSQAVRWAANDLKKYMAAGWAQVSGPGIYFLSEDGARWGQPPEETVVYGLWCANKGVGCHLPPQAGSGRPFPRAAPAFLRISLLGCLRNHPEIPDKLRFVWKFSTNSCLSGNSVQTLVCLEIPNFRFSKFGNSDYCVFDDSIGFPARLEIPNIRF